MDKNLPLNLTIQSSSEAPLPPQLKALEGAFELPDSVKHDTRTGNLNKIDGYIIQPGRNFVYITSIDENGAVLKRNVNLTDEAYPVS
jgi:hypothetical protein